MSRIPPFEDLKAPVKNENHVWEIEEQLYPESRGCIYHVFGDKETADMFYEMARCLSESEKSDNQSDLSAKHCKQKAFPGKVTETHHIDFQGSHGAGTTIEYRDVHYQGMDLRDWFAGQALSGWLSTYGDEESFPDEKRMKIVSENCFLMAGAMMKEMNKHDGK